MNIEPDLIASNLQAEYRLNVLTLSVDRTGGESNVLFELKTHDCEDHSARLTVPTEQIGLPRSEEEANRPEERFSVPDYLLHGLAGVLSDPEHAGVPLWVRFTAPSGLLPIIPWERWLQPALGVSVLRLPYHPILLPPPRQSFDSVICFSSPSSDHPETADRVADQFIRQIPADLAVHTTFHLFADLDVQPVLANIKREFGGRFDINIYDPNRAPESVDAVKRQRGAYSRSSIHNPWLLWMQEALSGRSADIVHFLSHCYLNREDGALALAQSPGKTCGDDCGGLVFAAELVDFLDATGAWSVAFSSPPSNHSAVGMRMLQDQVARLRPGPCLFHDMAHPDAAKGLAEAYRFLYVPSWQPPPHSPAVSLYCHPYRQRRDLRSDPESERLLSEFTLAGRVPDLLGSGGRPAWVATAQRVLEQNIGAFAVTPDNDERAAVVDGQKNAVRFIADLLAKHVQEGADTTTAPEVKPQEEDAK